MIWAIFFILLGIFLLYNRTLEKTGDDSGSEGAVASKPSYKTVYRSKDDRMLAGVCGGLARYFDVDSALVRLAYVLLTLASAGIGILAYIVMIIVFPEKKNDDINNISVERHS
ncbi:MAG: PspC domain-containing protein [Caldithrix sp.]|nr:PspC domain-containing protein [Caldithrix sp.]